MKVFRKSITVLGRMKETVMLERCMGKLDEFWDAIYKVKMIMDSNGNY